MKLIYVIIDGMGDLPVEELGDKTPLAVANTPNMDFLASKGKTGLMYTVREGFAPESDVAVVSLLGYDPFKFEVSRGVMEAVGSGMAFKDGDLALRCNFATLGTEGKIIDRRAGRDLKAEEVASLSKDITFGVRLRSHPSSFEFKNTTGHRGVLLLKGERIPLSGRITNTDPAYVRVNGLGVVNMNVEMVLQKCEPIDETEEARISAELVNEFVEKSHKTLEQSLVNRKRLSDNKLSANCILTRDAGHLVPRFFNINEKFKVKFSCLSDMSLERGIAHLAGMHVVTLPYPSGNLVEDCKVRVKKLLNVLGSYDCLYIHIKGPDEPGHDGDYYKKSEMIATIDKYFFGSLLPQISLEKVLLCVTADHATPSKLKTHSGDPVPTIISGGNVRGDDTVNFSEESCKKGSLGIIEHGYELMPELMRLLK